MPVKPVDNVTLLSSKNAESSCPAQHAESKSTYASSELAALVCQTAGLARPWVMPYNTNKYGLIHE